MGTLRNLVTLRGIRQIVAALALAVAAMLVAAPQALAFDFPSGTDCMKPPTPESPTEGVAGSIDAGPAKPVAGDPFTTPKDGSKPPSIYEVYGYGGLTVVRADPGCNPLQFDMMNTLTNLSMGASKVLVASSTSLYRLVTSSPFGPIFDPIQKAAQNVLGHGLFVPLVGLVLLAAATWIAVQARHAEVDKNISTVGRIVTIVAIGVACTVYPLTIGAAVDKGMGSVIGSVATLSSPDAAQDPATAVGGNIHEAVLFHSWEQATFGNGELNAKAAKEFGPRLFKAGANSRVEQAGLDAHPDLAEDFISKKKEAYKQVLSEIKAKYPQVYEYVAGNRTDSQFGFMAVGFLATLVATVFLLFSLAKLVYAMVAVRLGVGAMPAIALAATYPRYSDMAYNAIGVVWDAILKALYYGAATMLFIGVGIGGVLNPTTDLPWFAKIAALFGLTIGGYYFARRLGVANDISRARALYGRGRTTGGKARDVAQDAMLEGRRLAIANDLIHRTGDWETLTKTADDVDSSDGPTLEQTFPRRTEMPEYAMHNVRDIPRDTGMYDGAGKAAAKGAAKGAVTAGAMTVASGGTLAVPALATAAAKGAAGAGASQVLNNKAPKATNAARVVSPSAIYHPTSVPGSAAGPTTLAPTSRIGGKSVHSIYTPTGGTR